MSLRVCARVCVDSVTAVEDTGVCINPSTPVSSLIAYFSLHLFYPTMLSDHTPVCNFTLLHPPGFKLL